MYQLNSGVQLKFISLRIRHRFDDLKAGISELHEEWLLHGGHHGRLGIDGHINLLEQRTQVWIVEQITQFLAVFCTETIIL